MVYRILTLVLISSLAIGVTATADAPYGDYSLWGKVTSVSGDPLPGATVLIVHGDSVLAGTAADEQGRFRISLHTPPTEGLILRVSSIGFATGESTIPTEPGQAPAEIVLQSHLPQLSGIEVAARLEGPDPVLSGQNLTRQASRSLLAGNPVGALVQPQAARAGSSHSSRIRVNGTNPDYFINGINIGSDPHHYGVFSIIPEAVVDRLQFQPLGTSARYALPSVIELSATRRFEPGVDGQLNMSPLEAGGAFSFSTKRAYVIGSLRKSVLDKLARYFDMRWSRRTLPPTNFQDVFVSVGFKPTEPHRLIVDGYHVRDFLSFESLASGENPAGVVLFQHNQEQFIGLRYQGIFGRTLLTARASVREGSGEAWVHPEKNANVQTAETGSVIHFAMDLTEQTQTYLSGVELDVDLGRSKLTVGGEVEYVPRRSVSMTQTNWNFLPADAASDNPHLYQPELNQLFGSFADREREANSAAFASYSRSFGPWQSETGVRLERFGALSHPTALLVRQDLRLSSDVGEWRLAVGSYAQNPVGKVADPYQLLVRANLDRLEPIRTYLAAITYHYGEIKLSAFGKKITRLPLMTPDYDYVVSGEGPGAVATVQDGFITMRSTGEAEFVGGDITLTRDGFVSPRLDLYTFYGYTHAVKREHGVELPHDLSAPHRFYLQLDYRLNRKLILGADLAARSGYPYTPTTPSGPFSESDRYSWDYFRAHKSGENRARFAPSVSFDVHVSLDFGNSELYCNIANLTNRGNPIINTADGFVYDAGILPTVGYRLRF